MVDERRVFRSLDVVRQRVAGWFGSLCSLALVVLEQAAQVLLARNLAIGTGSREGRFQWDVAQTLMRARFKVVGQVFLDEVAHR
jgi:hypothetical protein